MTERHFRDLEIDEYFKYNLREDEPGVHTPEWSGYCRKYNDDTAIDETGEKFVPGATAVVQPSDVPIVEEYTLFAGRDSERAKRVRKATKVTLPGGFVVKFMDRLRRNAAVEQAEWQREGNAREATPAQPSHSERRVQHMITRGALHQSMELRDGVRTDRFTVGGRPLVLYQNYKTGTFNVMLEVATRNENDTEDFYRLDQAWAAARDFRG